MNLKTKLDEVFQNVFKKDTHIGFLAQHLTTNDSTSKTYASISKRTKTNEHYFKFMLVVSQA